MGLSIRSPDEPTIESLRPSDEMSAGELVDHLSEVGFFESAEENLPVARDALIEYTEPTPTPTATSTDEPTDEPTTTDSPGFGGPSALAGVGAGAAAAARRLASDDAEDEEE